MSVKHNVSHKEKFGRGKSRYPDRLAARGLSHAPHLAEIEGSTGLRARQERRVRETCTVGPNHDRHECNGQPWRVVEETQASETKIGRLAGNLASHYAEAA